MNRARVAEALRELAAAIEDDAPASEPAPKARRRAERLPPRPEGPVDELAQHRAKQYLRRKGYKTA